jgi:hypothetical protein
MAEGSRLSVVTRVTAIASLISLMVGIAISTQQLYVTLTAARDTLNALKLQALQQVTGFLDNNSVVRRELSSYIREQLEQDEANVQKQIAAGRSGEDIYYSKELEKYRRTVEHFERLGAVITLKYLDFDIVFEVIAFPDAFWEKTKNMRVLLGENWGGKGQPLNDFQSGFRRLCAQYKAERQRLHLNSAADLQCDK